MASNLALSAEPCSLRCRSHCNERSKVDAIVHIASRIQTRRQCGTRWRLTPKRNDWADKSLEHIQAGESDDAATCQRLRAKYHALWERVHNAQQLAEAEARADDMFASEARDPFANTAQWEASIKRGRPRLDFVNNRGE